MLALDSAFSLPGYQDLVLFADDSDPALVHLLALRVEVALTPAGAPSAQLMVLGDTSGFWQVTLRPAISEVIRSALAKVLEALSLQPMRLLSVEADISLTLSFRKDQVAASQQVANWRGTPLALSGDVAGDAVATLAKAWSDDLKGTSIALSAEVTGSPRPASATWTSSVQHVAASADTLSVTSQTETTRARVSSAEKRLFQRTSDFTLPRGSGTKSLIRSGRTRP